MKPCPNCKEKDKPVRNITFTVCEFCEMMDEKDREISELRKRLKESADALLEIGIKISNML